MSRLIWYASVLLDVQRIYRFDPQSVTLLAVRHQKEVGF